MILNMKGLDKKLGASLTIEETWVSTVDATVDVLFKFVEKLWTPIYSGIHNPSRKTEMRRFGGMPHSLHVIKYK